MAKATSKTAPKRKGRGKSRAKKPPFRPVRWALKWLFRGVLAVVAFVLLAIVFYAFVNPPTTPYMFGEGQRLGGVDHEWVPMEEIAPVMARAAVAAEDANYCLHWGLDVEAIQRAMTSGVGGASTISQQTVKNVYLWHGRSWFRKAMEAVLTPAVELVWSKRRILEVYLNIAEFDEGVFGVQAAAVHYFGVDAADLTATQAGRLAAVLPSPKDRSASDPSVWVRQRAQSIVGGAATIDADGRSACFQVP